mgnify:CR=1 FL=1
MKDRLLIQKGSVCEGDFIEGIDTIAEVRMAEREPCKFFPDNCPATDRNGPRCMKVSGQRVAQYAIKPGASLEAELLDFARSAPIKQNGYFDPTSQDPDVASTDIENVTDGVRKWAETVLGIQRVDAASVNNEYCAQPTEKSLKKYSVLGKSVFDDENNQWVHECGATLACAKKMHSVHSKWISGAGSGQVQVETAPYCPCCEKKPNSYGKPVYQEDIDAEEAAILRAMGKL